MNNIKKIAVIGGGNGGLATAADLTLAGFQINLLELPEFSVTIQPFIESKEIKISGHARQGIAKLNMVTTDWEEGLKDVQLILCVVPSYAHEKVAKELSAFIQEDQIVVLSPGSTGGSLVFHKTLVDLGKENVMLGEVNTLPYACRRTNIGTVDVFLSTHKLYFAAFPAVNADKVYDAYIQVYPQTVKFQNVLETGLNNGNPITHAPACILNAGRIEYAKGEYYHYQEGMTPSVTKVIEAVDNERLAICDALGYRRISAKERMFETGYTNNTTDSLYHLYTNSPAFCAKGPADLQSRYLTEDIPYGLVPWFLIGQLVGLRLPIMESIINIGSVLLGEDYIRTGRTLEKMGLSGLKVNELNEYLLYGK